MPDRGLSLSVLYCSGWLRPTCLSILGFTLFLIRNGIGTPDRGGALQLTLDDQELLVLREVVNERIDTLLLEIANTDSREFRDEVVKRQDILVGVYAKLGCSRPEGSRSAACDS